MTCRPFERRAVPRTRHASAQMLVGLLAFLVASCDDGGPVDAPDPTWVAADAPLALSFTASPVTGLDPSVRFASAIHYGSDPQQTFDAFLPDSNAPTAAVLYVHGGGFVNGTRTDVYTGDASAIHQLVDAGVAWIGVDYRLLLPVGVETEGVRKSLRDSRRALQFIRYHAAELNVDPARIGIYGESAGAGTSVWLGFHDEMAQKSNPDRIARESTRPTAVAAISTQATYDVMRWAPDVYGGEYPFVTNDLLLSVGEAVDLLIRFYGLPGELKSDTAALETLLDRADYRTYRADLDMLELASADDPPTYLVTTGADTGPLDPSFDLLHHPLHPKTLFEHATAAHVDIVAEVPAYMLAAPIGPMDFLLDHL